MSWVQSYQHGSISISCLSTGAARIILVTAPELQEDELGTKLSAWVYIYILSLHWCRKNNPGHGTRIARGFVRYKGEKGNFNFSHLYLLIHSSIWCHRKSWSRHQNCKRFGLVQLLVISIKSISEFP